MLIVAIYGFCLGYFIPTYRRAQEFKSRGGEFKFRLLPLINLMQFSLLLLINLNGVHPTTRTQFSTHHAMFTRVNLFLKIFYLMRVSNHVIRRLLL